VTLRKASATLGPVSLAAVGTITWQITTGVQPYITTLSCHRSDWQVLEGQIGERLNLKITDARGEEIEIRGVYILEQAPSTTPNLVSFRVADKRWRWSYELIARDFNMVRKTGDRTPFGQGPAGTGVATDQFEYLPYSLDQEGQTKWTAKRAVEDVMDKLEGQGTEAGGWLVESFPIEDGGGNPSRQFTLENLELRDAGDVALQRLLTAIPGCDVYINPLGQAVIFDASDIQETEKRFGELDADGLTYRGQRAAKIDRRAIRPKRVFVYYQREIEAVLEYEDDYRGTTSARPGTTTPFLENMVQTVDPITTMTIRDPNSGVLTTNGKIPAGSYVPMQDWLVAMDDDRPQNSAPWTFEAVRAFWMRGELDAAWGAGGGIEVDTTANVSARVQTFKQHFRQTFRLNPRYMQRVRKILPNRVGIINPVTGERAPAAIWGQYCVNPSQKGRMHLGSQGNYNPVVRNVNYLAPHDSGKRLIDTSPGPHRMVMVDPELGIFRSEWISNPYGLEAEMWPGFGGSGSSPSNFTPRAVSRNMALQDQTDTVMALDAVVESSGSQSGLSLSANNEMLALCTLVPAGPNNLLQFHREEVAASDVDAIFRSEARVQQGRGPDLHLFVAPNELTARFAWTDDGEAYNSLQRLFGLVGDGLEVNAEGDISGYTFVNRDNSIRPHAVSYAAEALVEYADGVEGEVATRVMPQDPLKLVGNMVVAAVRVDSEGVVDTVHAFPGKQRPFSRFALLPQSARSIILGTVT
jgi:hypothetical protein